ncbi:ATPase [Heyndrickxia sporothermodurans]|nr:ATPase [Heyndrickxia sporothermodurans]
MDNQITTKFKIVKPASDVFEAIVDPQKMSNYWFSSGSGRMAQGQTITWRYDEYNAEVDITVLEVEENKKIKFSWGETTVTMIIKELDQMSSIIEVSESGFKEDDPELINKMLGQKEGWVYVLTCLKAYLENGINNLRASLIH